MERYGTHCEQTYRTNFNRGRAKCIDWVKFNLALCRRYLNMDGLLAIAIDPSYISKSGKKTPHIGTFWSGCASSMKHGLEIMGLALVDVHANSCMMLRAHQTPSTGELKMRNMTLVQHYIAVIKRYKKDLLKVTDIVVADAFFSIRPFVDGIKECGFHLVSRFRDTASLYYVYTGPRSNKPGRPKTLDGKINYKKLDLTRMAELHIEGLEGTAYTLIAYSKALKQKVRLVIWVMPNGKHKLFFSTKTSMSGEEVLRTYRSRFQIEFCFRDAKQYTGLTHCQARHKNQLDFSYNASFASQNVAKVMMKENGVPYSMASFKEIMASTYIAKIIFDKCQSKPNRKLISHTIKELFGWQRKAAFPLSQILTNHCYTVARGFRLVLVSLSVVSLEQFHSLKLKLIDLCRLVGIYSMKQDVGLAHSLLYIGGVGTGGCAPVSLSHIHLRRTWLPVRANRLVQAPFSGLQLHAVCENTLRLFG